MGSRVKGGLKNGDQETANQTPQEYVYGASIKELLKDAFKTMRFETKETTQGLMATFEFTGNQAQIDRISRLVEQANKKTINLGTKLLNSLETALDNSRGGGSIEISR